MRRSARRHLGTESVTSPSFRRIRIVGMSSLALPAWIALPAAAVAAPATDSSSTVGSIPPSVTSIPGITVDTQGTIHYSHATADTRYLSGATTKVVRGQRNSAGGCNLRTSSPSTTDYSVETSFNPSTCEATFVSGHITPSGATALGVANPSSGPTGASPTSTFGSPSSNITPQALSAAADYNGYWSAFNKVSWVDPVDLTIVSIADNLTWQISGSTIPWASAYYVPYQEHLVGDVTTRTGGNLWWSSGSGYTESWSDSNWTNSDFEAYVVAVMGIAGYAACGFNSSPAQFYLQADTAGWKNATFTAGWDSSNSGGCVDLTWLRQNDGPGSGS